MAYGFNLDYIEGLDSSVPNVTLTLSKDAVSNSYYLTYISDDSAWVDNPNNIGISLSNYEGEGAYLNVESFDETDVGDEYTINLSATNVTDSFKTAVEKVLVEKGVINETTILFDGTLTIDSLDPQPVEIIFDTDISKFSTGSWDVSVNGEKLIYDSSNNSYNSDGSGGIAYSIFPGETEGQYMFGAYDITDEPFQLIPGDYNATITAVEPSGTNLPPIDTSTSYGNYNINVDRYGEISYQHVQMSRIPATGNNKMYIPARVGNVVDYLNEGDGIDVSTTISPCTYMLTYRASASPAWQLKSITVPTTAGNYILKATVASGGTVTFSFVSE